MTPTTEKLCEQMRGSFRLMRHVSTSRFDVVTAGFRLQRACLTPLPREGERGGRYQATPIKLGKAPAWRADFAPIWANLGIKPSSEIGRQDELECRFTKQRASNLLSTSGFLAHLAEFATWRHASRMEQPHSNHLAMLFPSNSA